MREHRELVAFVAAELPPFVTINELARVLRVNAITVRRWIAEGRLDATKTGEAQRSRMLIARSSIVALLERSNPKAKEASK